LKEVFGGSHHPVPIDEANVLGILSLVFWSLMLIVSVKYIAFIMRANNKGEGRHHGADGARAAQREGPRSRSLPDAAGALRRRALLRRRPHHAGDLGALRGRGPGDRGARRCNPMCFPSR
jgi:hypothetical protein